MDESVSNIVYKINLLKCHMHIVNKQTWLCRHMFTHIHTHNHKCIQMTAYRCTPTQTHIHKILTMSFIICVPWYVASSFNKTVTLKSHSFFCQAVRLNDISVGTVKTIFMSVMQNASKELNAFTFATTLNTFLKK